jgi:methyltransferase (TIGR00027 family)
MSGGNRLTGRFMTFHSTQENRETVAGPPPKPSALRVAILRAVHQLLDLPVIFEDPLALRILGTAEEDRLRRDPMRHNTPALVSLRTSIVLRSRLADDEWARARQNGVRQFVILGAGLDTSAYRNPDHGDSRIYEVDISSTQEWKRDCLRAAGIEEPASLTFVPIDFETSSLSEALTKAGFNGDEPAFFSWLGVSMYLEEDVFLNTLRFICSLAPRSGVVFDYAVSPMLLSPSERKVVEFFATRAAEHGERWKTFFDPASVAATLLSLGFNEVQDLGPDELHDLYLAGRTDGLRKSRGSHLICAKI